MRWVKAVVITAIVLVIIPTMIMVINRLPEEYKVIREEYSVTISPDNITKTVHELYDYTKLDENNMVTNFSLVQGSGIPLNITSFYYRTDPSRSFVISYYDAYTNTTKDLYLDLDDPSNSYFQEPLTIELYDEEVISEEYTITIRPENITEKVYELYNHVKLNENNKVTNFSSGSVTISSGGTPYKITDFYYSTNPSRRFVIKYYNTLISTTKTLYLDLDDPVGSSDSFSSVYIKLYDEEVIRDEYTIRITNDNITEVVNELYNYAKLDENNMVTNFSAVLGSEIPFNVTSFYYRTDPSRSFVISYYDALTGTIKDLYLDLDDPIGGSSSDFDSITIYLYDEKVVKSVSSLELLLISLTPLILVSGLLIYQYKELGLNKNE